MSEQFRQHFGHCQHLYGVLLDVLADDLEAGGATDLICRGYGNAPRRAAVQLRLLAAIFRIVLRGDAPQLEYLWSAAWSLFDEADPAAEIWVRDRAVAILEGNAREVAAGIRRRATNQHLDAPRRRNADACAAYLTNKAPYLDYPTALTAGWPIATGIIEGACRHIVKDRMDLTGARWGLDGAEAVLKLRTLRSNGHLPEYWNYHLRQGRRRIHESRYANTAFPLAA